MLWSEAASAVIASAVATVITRALIWHVARKDKRQWTHVDEASYRRLVKWSRREDGE